MDSCANDLSYSLAHVTLGPSVYKVSGEKSSVTSSVEYSTESDIDSIHRTVYPVFQECAVDVKPVNLSICSETESHLDKEVIFVASGGCSPLGTFCEDPIPLTHSADIVPCHVSDSTCHLNLSSSSPMEQFDSAFVTSCLEWQ